MSILRPDNQIIFCEKSWKLMALLLAFVTLFTALWGVYLIGFEFDDYELEEYAIIGHARERGGRFLNNGLHNVANDSLLPSLQQQVGPAIAHIHSLNLPAKGELPKVLASGVVIHPSGYLITTDHSLQGRRAVIVDIKTAEGIQRYQGEVVRRDPSHDLALIKLNRGSPTQNDRFLYLKLASGAPAAVHALGLNTASEVIGSSGTIRRQGLSLTIGHHNLHQLWRSDAVQQWEQSGGPLVNDNAELVGINLALSDSLGQVQGYVIPAEVISAVFQRQVKLTLASPAAVGGAGDMLQLPLQPGIGGSRFAGP
ncbi:MAG: trypsin-like peptidase domain-containing protein [Gammaproteobacteria bacterium]|nr:trypsin-like peptidase domain-containing protein [Gammaproteobacteria bacterium]